MADRDSSLKYSGPAQLRNPYHHSVADARSDSENLPRNIPRQMPPVNHVRQRHRSEAFHPNLNPDPLRPRRMAIMSMLVAPESSARHAEVDGMAPLSFDDEYDLYPKIMQDVERAVFLKRQREARLRAQKPADTPWQHEHRRASSSTTTSTPSPQPLSRRRVDEVAKSDTPSSSTKSMESAHVTDLNSHPLPCSVDDGRTLDWSSAAGEDRPDKRWTLSLSKRRGHGTSPSLASTVDQVHKLEKIYTEHINNIKQKSSFQTISRATVVKHQLERRYQLISSSPHYSTLSILDVYKWYREQDPDFRHNIEAAEPFSWLKSYNSPPTSPTSRPPWCLSVAIIDAYLQSQTLADGAQGYQLPNLPSSPADSARSSPVQQSTRSRTSETRLPPVYEDGVYESRDASPPMQSETSSRNEIMEESAQGSGSSQHSKPASEFGSPLRIVIEEGSPSSGFVSPPECKEGTSAPTSNLDVEGPSRSRISLRKKHAMGGSESARSTRASLFSVPQTSKPASSPRKADVDEKRLAIGYLYKTRALADITSQNARNRQLLHRISALVREFEGLQGSTLKPLGIREILHVKELSESLNHDPAAVIGNTRKLNGWKAVEDIHHRCVSQRALFRKFLDVNHAPNCNWSLDESVESLCNSLQTLDHHQKVISEEGLRVSALLKKMREMHGDVKETYRKVLAETSTPYTELSDIVALEENYRDNYQQIWEWCMNVLTFMLDTITPFWRTYGKTISEDIRDFLIVPLYRNEFTGESKRYPLKALPQRTYCHWVALSLFCIISWVVTTSATYLAIFLMSYYRLQWIPYESFRWIILPIFWSFIVSLWVTCTLGASVSILQLGTLTWWLGWSIRVFS